MQLCMKNENKSYLRHTLLDNFLKRKKKSKKLRFFLRSINSKQLNAPFMDLPKRNYRCKGKYNDSKTIRRKQTTFHK